MKVLKYIVTVLLWTVLTLYVVTAVSLRIPSVQSFIGSRVADAVAKKLGTEVSVGNVSIGMPPRIVVDNIVVRDRSHQVMLNAARLSAKLDLWALVTGRISIPSAQLFSAHAHLYREHAGEPVNCQFVVDALSSSDSTSQHVLDLRINSFIMRRSSISYDQLDLPETPGRFNASHLQIGDISAHVVLKALRNDSLNVSIKRLAFTEQSGLRLNNLSFHLAADRRAAQLTGLTVVMPDSRLVADSLTATYRFGPSGLQASTLEYQGAFRESYITPSDLRAFMPPLKNYQHKVSIDTQFFGTDSGINIPQLDIGSETGDVNISANGWLHNWDDDHPSWQATVARLSLSDRFIDFLTKSSPQIPMPMRRLGSLHLSGFFSGASDGTLTAKGTVTSSAVGQATLQLRHFADHRFTATVETADANLSQLLDDTHFGQLTANLQVAGHHDGHQPTSITAVGSVSQVTYNGYPFTGITVNGTYTPSSLSGSLSISDPNLTAHIEGDYSRPKVQLVGSVSNFAPKALHLSEQWGSARFSADIDADFTATTLNDAKGKLSIRNLSKVMANNDGPDYFLERLDLTSGYDQKRHFLTLESDFGQASLTGTFDYRTLAQSVVNAIASQLPELPGLPKARRQADNDFTLGLTLHKTDFLQAFLNVPLTLTQPLSLHAVVNDRTCQMTVDAEAPAFIYDDTRYQTATLKVAPTAKGALQASLAVARLGDEDGRLDLSADATMHDNSVAATLRWNNHNELLPIAGQLNTTTHFTERPAGGHEAHVHVEPSTTIVGSSSWNIAPADITYSDHDLTVSHFTIFHDDQHITVGGKASASPNDILTVDFNRVEVAYFLDLVNFTAVAFGGEATGRATLSRLFTDEPSAEADLRVDHFTFEGGGMGTLHAKAGWNNRDEQIDISATADAGPDSITLINGYVAPSSSARHPQPNINLGIEAKGSPIGFLHSYTSAFLSGIQGSAYGNLRVIGPLSHINLTGNLIADGQATVIPLGTTYQLRQAPVTFVPNEISLDSIPVYDRYGTKGYLSGGIHHDELTNLTFDLFVDADNLLAFDQPTYADQSFCGTVFATGTAAIQGRRGRVTIDCNITPQPKTVFNYNASQTSGGGGNRDYITWGSQPAIPPPSSAPLQSGAGSGTAAEASGGGTDLYFTLQINTTPDGTLRLLMDEKTGDYITLNGNGALRATYYNKGTFQMFGTYTVERGTYDITIQNIIQKHFTFQPGGTIVFGGDPYEAALALQAMHTVQGVSLSDLSIGNTFSSNTIRVNCLMNISGQPKAPQVTFDLEMPTVNADEQQMVRAVINGEQAMNQQVLHLLGIGRFYNTGQNNAANQQDPTALAMQSLLSGTLTAQINNILTQVVKNDSWHFGANISTGTEGWNNAEYEGIVNGRMLNNRLLINGQFGYRDKATQATPSFIGDFDLRYLLLPNGNLALKVYNQTNDRYFTRSSLNTQGIGIIMKKDFNGLRELLSLKKKKRKKSAKE